jgi:transmembrane sensor
MNNNSNHIEPELLTKYLSREINDEEERIVKEWIEASPANKNHLEELKLIWDKSTEVSDFDLIDAEADWSKVKARFGDRAKVVPIDREKDRSFLTYFTRIAAVLILIAGISLIFYKYSKTDDADFIAVSTAADEEREVELPDGSKVFLNANSRLSYSENFATKRELSLEGEAFFEVRKDKSSPFRVKANGTVTEVLGTTFDVKAYSGSEKTVVTLMTGKVAFYKQDDQKEKVLMEKGEQAVFSNGKITKKGTEDENVIAWKENKLTFNNSKVDDVVFALEAYFGKKIEVRDAKLYNCRYTGFFPDPKFDTVFEVVSVTLNAKVEQKGDVYILTGPGCE